jgi:exopolysaccharide biosynthesis WecB/TagA/CpsF family protein
MSAPRVTWRHIDCLGVRVGQPSWAELREWFFSSVRGTKEEGSAQSLYLVNAHTLNLAYVDRAYRRVLDRSSVVLNDGIGLDLYAKLAGAAFAYDFNGTDLFPRLFTQTEESLSVFLYGARPGRAEQAARNIEAIYSKVRVAGVRDGFGEDALDAINEVRPDLVLVGMGNPRQELWIDESRARLRAGVVCGVGALIDFLSGAIPRAPLLLRRLRLEWTFRLALEPRRMFARYVFGNPAFVARSVHYLAARRARGSRA